MVYACIIWDDCAKYNVLNLENCQLQELLLVQSVALVTSYFYDQTKWPTLQDGRKLCFAHKLVNKTAPNYLIELMPNTVNRSRYNLRDNGIEQYPHFRTEKFLNSVFPDCIRLWNGLDNDIKKEESLNKFKQ